MKENSQKSQIHTWHNLKKRQLYVKYNTSSKVGKKRKIAGYNSNPGGVTKFSIILFSLNFVNSFPHIKLECVECREGYNSNPEERKKNTTQTQTWYIEKKGKRKIIQIQKVKLQFHDFSNIEKTSTVFKFI